VIRTFATVFLFLAFAAGAQDRQLTFFTVGSGDVTGGYFSAARAICTTINHTENGRLRCSPDPTSGSLYNLSMLNKRELDFALVQSDWQRFAYEGMDIYSGRAAMPTLRSVMGLYPETITIIARAESGIERPADLVGKSVDMGPPSSGRFASISRLFELFDFKLSDFESVFGFTQARAIDELCAGNLDAAVLIVGHPNSNVARALEECGAQLIPFDNQLIEQTLGAATDYQKLTIPLTSYPELAADVSSYAVFSTIVTRADVDTKLVEIFVTRILENLDDLSNTSAVLSGLSTEGLRNNGLTAPLHPGAELAYSAFKAKGSAENDN
jgi:TRAP transporter TAXI family solute receptor